MTNLEKALEAFHTRPANLRDRDSKKVKCHQCNTRMTLGELRTHKHRWVDMRKDDADDKSR